MPEVTGNDILAYQGNAGLAAGANNGIVPYQGNPYQGLNDTLARVQEQDAQMNILKYHQKIKDQEDLAQTLANLGNNPDKSGNLFNAKDAAGNNVSLSPLPQDKAILDQKVNELRRLIIASADGKKYDYDPDILAKRSEYRALTNHAQIRSAAQTRYNVEAAQSNSQEERNSIHDQAKTEIFGHQLGEYYTPEPHMPNLTFDPDMHLSRKEVTDAKNHESFHQSSGIDQEGNLVYDTKNGVGGNTLDIRSGIVPGSKLYNNAVNMSNAYIRSIQGDPDMVIQQNQSIDQINKERGYVNAQGQPVSPHYIPHVAEVVQGQDGQPKVQVTAKSPQDIVYSVLGERYGALHDTPQIKKDADTLEKEDVGIKKTRHDMTLEDEKLALEREKARSATDKETKPIAEELKQRQSKQAVQAMTDEVSSVFGDATKDKKPVGASYPAFWKKNGIDPDNYKIYPEIKNATAAKYVGIPAPEVTTTTGKDGNKSVVKSKGGSLKMDKIVPIEDKSTGEKKLVFIKDGQFKAIVSPRDAVINGIKHEAGYIPKEYEDKLPYVDAHAAPSPASSPSISPAGKKKNINGVNYEQGSDGKWYVSQ